MITFFTIPKPFKGEIAVIQRNAIESWLRLDPRVEVILYGDDEGIAETSSEFGIKNISDIKKNGFGTPMLDFVFEQTKKNAENGILCYINTDIILLSDFFTVVRQIQKENFLLIGERSNITISEPINFNDKEWEADLKGVVIAKGRPEGFWGMDFFVFPKNSALHLLPFAVGRMGWDNWLIYHARVLGIDVIDISPSIKVIHQNHGYTHIPQKRDGERWDGPESDSNLKLIGGGSSRIYFWNILDATWIFKNKTLIKKPLSRLGMYRQLILIVPTYLHPIFVPFIMGLQKMRHKFNSFLNYHKDA